MDVGGLALASSISSVISAIFLFIPLQKKYKNLISKSLLVDLLKMICSAVIMTIVAMICKNSMLLLSMEGIIKNLIVVVLPAVAGGICYMLICYILGVEESKQALQMAKGLLKKVAH